MSEQLPAVKSFRNVEPGLYLNKIAVIEKLTGEPLQYITARFQDESKLLQHVEMMCGHWDAFLEEAKYRARR